MDGSNSSDPMACTWSGLQKHDLAKHAVKIKRRMIAETAQKAELRKSYDAQVAEVKEKKRIEIEKQKKYAEEQAKELVMWQNTCDARTVKAKQMALEEKELRDVQVERERVQKMDSLANEMRHHVKLMESIAREKVKSKQAVEAKAAERAEFFQTTRAQALELTRTKQQFFAQEKSQEAAANVSYSELCKKYEKQRQAETLVKSETLKQEGAKIRAEKAAAAREKVKAAMIVDMEEVRAREEALERQEKERRVKAKDLRNSTAQFIKQQMVEKKEQKSKEVKAWKELPQPIPAWGASESSTSKHILARDLVTAHVFDFARSEEEEKAKGREQRLQHRKELEAQISARGRPFPGLNICSRSIEPRLSSKEMSLNRRLISELPAELQLPAS